MELVYTRSKHPLCEGRVYRNPRFFSGPEAGVTRVFVLGEFPKIVAAYLAAGVPVLAAAPERPARQVDYLTALGGGRGAAVTFPITVGKGGAGPTKRSRKGRSKPPIPEAKDEP